MNLVFRALEQPKERTLGDHKHLECSTVEILMHSYNGKKGLILLLDNKVGTLSGINFFLLLYSNWYELSNVPLNKDNGHTFKSIQIEEDDDDNKHLMWLSKKDIRLLYYFLVDRHSNDLERFNEIKDMLPQRSINKILNDLKVAS